MDRLRVAPGRDAAFSERIEPLVASEADSGMGIRGPP